MPEQLTELDLNGWVPGSVAALLFHKPTTHERGTHGNHSNESDLHGHRFAETCRNRDARNSDHPSKARSHTQRGRPPELPESANAKWSLGRFRGATPRASFSRAGTRNPASSRTRRNSAALALSLDSFNPLMNSGFEKGLLSAMPLSFWASALATASSSENSYNQRASSPALSPVVLRGRSGCIAHLLCVLWRSGQLGPDQVEVIGSEIAPSYFCTRLSLNGWAVLNRHAPGLPVANGGGSHIEALSQFLPPTYREARAVQGVWCLCHAKSITHDVFNFNTTC